jgi:hypothetical protein
MTEQEIMAKKGRMFAVFGVGIAAFIGAYVMPSDGVVASLVPLVFIGVGFVCIVVAGRMARDLKKEPAAK